MVYKTNLLIDYIYRPVSSIEYDVSDRASLRNVVFYRNQTMDIFHKQVSLVSPVIFEISAGVTMKNAVF
jgi:hypothetical protein